MPPAHTSHNPTPVTTQPSTTHLVANEVFISQVQHAPRQHRIPVLPKPVHQLYLVRNICA